MTYFFLNSHCYLISGRVNSAIYDLKTGTVYSLNKYLSKVIKKCEQRTELQKICCDFIKMTDLKQTLSKLKDAGLGDFYSSDFIVEKKKPLLTKRQKKNIGNAYKLQTLSIEVTNECTLNCQICNPQEKRAQFRFGCKRWPVSEKCENIKSLNWSLVISDAKKLGCNLLEFLGGDPLLDFEFVEKIMRIAKYKGITQFSLTTNGMHINEKILQKIEGTKILWKLLLFSSDSAMHETLVRTQGCFSQLLDNISLLQQYNFPYCFIHTICEQNYSTMEKDYQEFEKLKPLYVVNNYVYPNKFDMKTYQRNGDYLSNLLMTKKTLKMCKIDKEMFFQRCEGHPCWEGRLAITRDGTVFPCFYYRYDKIGNVTNKDLRKMFRDGDVDKFWDLTKDSIIGCNECEYRFLCNDCRAIENDNCKNLNGKNRFCTYEPQLGIWKDVK